MKLQISKKTLYVINISFVVLFILFSLLLTGTYKIDFLNRMQELSLFIANSMFFTEKLAIAGGMLEYAGNFLTQFFYYPWLGTAIFIFMLCALSLTLYKVMGIKPVAFMLCFVPAGLLLLFVTQLDYVIFTLKAQGIIFSQLTGLIVAVLIFRLYKVLPHHWLQALFTIVITVIAYPLIGFYGLLTIAFIAIDAIKQKNRIVIAIAPIMIVSVPFLYYYLVYDNINIQYIFFAGLPYKDFVGIHRMWYPLVVTIMVTLMLPFASGKKDSEPHPLVLLFSFVAYIGTMVCVYAYTYKDENFHHQLAMERTIAQGNWNAVLDVAKKTTNPSPPIELYRNVALLRTGKLCNSMFTYPQQDPYIVQPKMSLPPICGPIAFFQYGCLNSSYRWAMELGIKFGMNIEYLKLMTKVAIYNNEPELARKYLTTLNKTMFHKKWAKHYMTYVNNPDLLKNDPEYKVMMELKGNELMVWDMNEDVISTLYMHGAYLPGKSPMAQELCMATNMLIRNNQLFWPVLFSYIEQNVGKTVPKHLQEAALLFAYLEENEQLLQYAVSLSGNDRKTVSHFEGFLQMAQQRGLEKDKHHYNIFKQSFSNTYWFYYYFK